MISQMDLLSQISLRREILYDPRFSIVHSVPVIILFVRVMWGIDDQLKYKDLRNPEILERFLV